VKALGSEFRNFGSQRAWARSSAPETEEDCADA
jgi:hypothetical protein